MISLPRILLKSKYNSKTFFNLIILVKMKFTNVATLIVFVYFILSRIICKTLKKKL